MNQFTNFRILFFKKTSVVNFGFLGSFIILFSMIITAIFYKSPSGQIFNPFNHFISELGFIGVSNVAWLFNYGIFLGGLLLSIFMFGLGGFIKSKLSTISSIFGIIACWLGASIGLFPMNDVNSHIIIALSFFLLSTFTMLLYSIAIYLDSYKTFPKLLALYGILVVLAFIVFLFNPLDTSAVKFAESFTAENIANLDNIRPQIWGVAILEWISVLSIIVWVILISTYIHHKRIIE